MINVTLKDECDTCWTDMFEGRCSLTSESRAQLSDQLPAVESVTEVDKPRGAVQNYNNTKILFVLIYISNHNNSLTSCQPLRASQRLINPGEPFKTTTTQRYYLSCSISQITTISHRLIKPGELFKTTTQRYYLSSSISQITTISHRLIKLQQHKDIICLHLYLKSQQYHTG